MLDKGKIFEKMVQHHTVFRIMRAILGDDVQLGSIATNTLFPGGSGQEPHLDYPYWDYYNKDHLPPLSNIPTCFFHELPSNNRTHCEIFQVKLSNCNLCEVSRITNIYIFCGNKLSRNALKKQWFSLK